MNFFNLIKPNDVEVFVAHRGLPREIQANWARGEIQAKPADEVAVSIVIPSYNSISWLRQALEAIYELQVPTGGCEVVIVDDGSTDDTPNQLREMARRSPWPFLGLRLLHNRGRSTASNVGIQYASGQIIALTSADCLPDARWLTAALPHFEELQVGIVQGQTLPVPSVHQPFFNHFMEVTGENGHYETCNILYRRQVLLDVGGLDPALDSDGSLLGAWDDIDLGWRVQALGWRAVFESKALVYHQIVPISFWQWLKWPARLGRRVDITAHYPAYRRFLYRRIWIERSHTWLTLALLGSLLALAIHPLAALLAVPYLAEMPRRYGLAGRWPLAKLALHIAWDLIGFTSLLLCSARFGCIVL